MLRLIGVSFRTASVAILHLFGMDQACLTCHLSGPLTGQLDVCRMRGELIVLDRGVRLLALLGVLVDSSVAVFPSLGSVDLLSFSKSTSRSMSRCSCRCFPAHLVHVSNGAQHFRDGNCLR